MPGTNDLRSTPMTIQAGETLPDATLSYLKDGVQSITVRDLCAGKTVVIFAVPGAFTPTCSARHLPGYVEHLEAFRAKGVDAIACLAVNDAFVMDAWRQNQHVPAEIYMLADGNAAFTKALGLELDASKFGMGVRSQRYALVVKDGVVSQVFVEAPGEFKVSSAEAVLGAL